MSKGRLLHIDRVEVRGPHVLHVEFDDGVEKTVDLSPLLTGPMFEPLRDPQKFAEVKIDPEWKTVVWPSGADIAPEALYDLPSLSDQPGSA
ncbi:MAG TPA: DUF2442 domain-containing protein [Acidobacteriota bacterium]|nr:DUF2442 domain-containing protein [Acidobacteriota bacterium]